MSLIAWLDASERDRRQMLDVIQLFQQKETVDELGVGSIRDTIADWLAPGTSTVQTRARYFFFVPWIYRDLERRKTLAEQVGGAARREEIALAAALAKSPDPAGTIGIDAGPALKRLPSAVYWAGLKRLGFRLFDGSQDRYHRVFASARARERRDDANEPIDDYVLPGTWNPHIPAAPPAFAKSASHQLTAAEATFFADQLGLHAQGTLLHVLVECRDSGDQCDFPWDHPNVEEMPVQLRLWLDHGRCYSEVMHGAALLYNLMLAERRANDEWIERYRLQIDDWAALVYERRLDLTRWKRQEFWSLIRQHSPRIPSPAVEFSNRWIDAVTQAGDVGHLAGKSVVRDLIVSRERQLKGGRARLLSAAHLDVWGGASGTGRLDYRWGITRTIARDIIKGFATSQE